MTNVNGQHVRVAAIAQDHMKGNLAKTITIDDLARLVLYSRFHFLRMFKKATGKTPIQYLADLRFEEAVRLLNQTTLTVKEICQQIGYRSPTTFSARFQQRYGMSPYQYRTREENPEDGQ